MTTKNKYLSSLPGRLYAATGPVLAGLYVSYRTLRGNDEAFFWDGRRWSAERGVSLPEPRILFHGASVGEITGILPVIKSLNEMGFSGSVIISTGTPAGFRRVKALAEDKVLAVPAPFDVLPAVANFLNSLKPSLYVLFEADYWPATILSLAERSIPAVLCNGRISSPSFRLYRLCGGLFRGVFSHFSWMGMVHERDRTRAISLGADFQRVEVVGSTKYDLLAEQVGRLSEVYKKWKGLLPVADGVPVMVAGSLRGQECRAFAELAVDLFAEFAELVCILAPRHGKRVSELERECARAGVPARRLSAYLNPRCGSLDREDEIRRQIIIVDTVGHLFELYSLADLAFCGGTFEKIGGHNIVEPVVWGCPVIFGPHVFKVSREADLLEKAGAGIRVENLSELYSAVKAALKGLHRRKIDEAVVHALMGELAGVSKICAARIMEILS
ncbi:3-deoxy-D-manno-octulosonic acid transferase [Thermodesulforhabdus norvegica]|uniref:3-deoxy-D-manno-octulosonic acid transferase n=1 Tax=Thermodesulforhabdus norvegica TaxID=39841 RepID=A0A1I4RDF6_9BACT|nr:glycosyltransferase N-terminal domain-containing protein [Thermodesulforhabdus norvegica]SFM50076.1 3-deoxy-D-manno-octulosonic-acid transferase [Thermodesulforhabdus norvegica]